MEVAIYRTHRTSTASTYPRRCFGTSVPWPHQRSQQQHHGEKNSYINHCQLGIIHVRIHKERRAASRTEFMHPFLLSEEVTLQMILATVKDDVCTLWTNVEIAIFAAYRTVAIDYCFRFQRFRLDFVLDGSTVAVGFVPDRGWSIWI